MTHRLAWALANGPIPDGLWVLHVCDVKRCCNPDHLYLGTHKDNVLDAVMRQRFVCGEQVITSKLTEREVLEIRSMHATKKFTYEQMAEIYGMKRTAISAIVNRRAWKHV